MKNLITILIYLAVFLLVAFIYGKYFKTTSIPMTQDTLDQIEEEYRRETLDD